MFCSTPLTKMTEAIRRLGDRHASVDCPRLEWEGRDEFATLATSVNMMLETITSRSVEVAQTESRQRALIAGIPDALAVFDRRGRLVSVMKQPEGTPPLVGFKAGEPPSAEVFGEEACKGFRAAVESVFAGKGVVTCRFDVLGKDGGEPERYFEVRLARMDEVVYLWQDGAGDVVGIEPVVQHHVLRLTPHLPPAVRIHGPQESVHQPHRRVEAKRLRQREVPYAHADRDSTPRPGALEYLDLSLIGTSHGIRVGSRRDPQRLRRALAHAERRGRQQRIPPFGHPRLTRY